MTDPGGKLYDDDAAHPIPTLGSLDMVGRRRDGGVDLMVVVSGPLRADERSQRRLLRKIELYLGFIASPDFSADFGPPDPGTTAVVVVIDGQSDDAIFQLLGRCEPWVREGKATLVVERR